MTNQGVERAAAWGWPNIYTYTKSMGDQLVVRETGIVRAIVRPAIVESAVAYPFRGWNEGFTTSAPLVYLALKGQNTLPVSPKLILDVVPVDHVVSAMLMVAAQAIVEQPKLVFQLSSGDLNPMYMDRVTTLTGLYKRKRFRDKETGNRFVNELAARMEFRPVTQEHFDKFSLPRFNRVAKGISRRWERSDRGGAPGGSPPSSMGQEGVRRDGPGDDGGGREHRAVPPVHLRERLRLPGRQHPRPARPDAGRGPGQADLGA